MAMLQCVANNWEHQEYSKIESNKLIKFNVEIKVINHMSINVTYDVSTFTKTT